MVKFLPSRDTLKKKMRRIRHRPKEQKLLDGRKRIGRRESPSLIRDDDGISRPQKRDSQLLLGKNKRRQSPVGCGEDNFTLSLLIEPSSPIRDRDGGSRVYPTPRTRMGLRGIAHDPSLAEGEDCTARLCPRLVVWRPMTRCNFLLTSQGQVSNFTLTGSFTTRQYQLRKNLKYIRAWIFRSRSQRRCFEFTKRKHGRELAERLVAPRRCCRSHIKSKKKVSLRRRLQRR